MLLLARSVLLDSLREADGVGVGAGSWRKGCEGRGSELCERRANKSKHYLYYTDE